MPSISDLPNLSSGAKLAITISIIVFVSLLVALIGARGIVTLYTAFQECGRPKEEKSTWDAETGLSDLSSIPFAYELEDGASRLDHSPRLPNTPPAAHVPFGFKQGGRPGYSVHEIKAAARALDSIRTGFSALELHDYAWPSRPLHPQKVLVDTHYTEDFIGIGT